MNIFGDFHSHTKTSDGFGTLEENLEQAEKQGLKYLAAVEHGFSTIGFHQTLEKFKAQQEEITNLQKTTSVKILRGLETNITGFDGKLDVDEDTIKQLDVLHFGTHRFIHSRRNGEYFVFALVNGFAPRFIRASNTELTEKNTVSYIKVMEKYPIDVVCHLLSRAIVDVKRVCDAAKANGCYIELNEKHIDAFEDCIDIVLASGVNLILGSDAHRPKDIGKFTMVEDFIDRHHVPKDRIVGIGMEPKFKNK
ncbi:MAG TPA: PHP domain-containing protein [Clostridia bacterium]|nr:PHP domain-containing protein [Clostridia bacterium]